MLIVSRLDAGAAGVTFWPKLWAAKPTVKTKPVKNGSRTRRDLWVGLTAVLRSSRITVERFMFIVLGGFMELVDQAGLRACIYSQRPALMVWEKI
jgi:hypothetical protein